MHFSSLHGRFGIGDLGAEARDFARTCARAGFSVWQVLPFTPVARISGYSPYSSTSAFAGNFLFISPEDLCKCGLLSQKDIDCAASSEARADFEYAAKIRKDLIRRAWNNFSTGFTALHDEYEDFCREAFWLCDYALFTVLKEFHEGRAWADWPRPYAMRDKAALDAFAEAHRDEISLVKFEQFIFFRQLAALRRYCSSVGVTIFGDMPIYVAWDSADVWTNRALFDLAPDGAPRMEAGVPPDYFSKDGQLWGNPVYNWDEMKKDNFAWWRKRFLWQMKFCGIVRIDHFRGLCAFWEVPHGEKTAVKGRWHNAFARELLTALSEDCDLSASLVAEDLGVITDEVREVMADFSLSGMKVLQFAFGCGKNNPYLPHNMAQNSAAYTGTHDNDTSLGWWMNASSDERRRLSLYTGAVINNENAAKVMCRIALASPARLAILPIQDIIGLGSEGRMNTPSVTDGNWAWRLLPEQFEEFANVRSHDFFEMNEIYDRIDAQRTEPHEKQKRAVNIKDD